MLLLGIDLGTSSVKVSVVDAATRLKLASAQYPQEEAAIISPAPGWAEQDPSLWWKHVQEAILACHATGLYHSKDIAAIGISYQMHGLVITGKEGQALRNAIIWCDGRAVATGDRAQKNLGTPYCFSRLLNGPGNFTASKLAWVKEEEPWIYEQAQKIMLPGDFIAYMLTGELTTTVSALSEGVFWDFRSHAISKPLMETMGIDEALIPKLQTLFETHGEVSSGVAALLDLKPGIPVSYKAGDQLNNAFSLNVLEPGEVAATAGTSGVIYGVTDQLAADPKNRINSFAHVNHSNSKKRIGVLLCINGTGIFNRWMRNLAAPGASYPDWNEAAASVPEGAGGVLALPFGNGPERMLGNKTIGAHISGLDLNQHGPAHLARAAQEGIAFAFRYGLEIMRGNGLSPSVIRAGKANMFLSKLFTQSFVNITGVPVQLYDTDGSVGAALGAGLGAGLYSDHRSLFSGLSPLATVEPEPHHQIEAVYQRWENLLQSKLT